MVLHSVSHVFVFVSFSPLWHADCVQCLCIGFGRRAVPLCRYILKWVHFPSILAH